MPGMYYVTICTKGKICWFGRIVEGNVTLSKIGIIIKDEWMKNESVRKNITLDEWVIMPNHFHGIINIKDHVETSRRDVSTNTFKLKSNSLGSIINQFKSACTKRIKKLNIENFNWQPRYYEHIIRSERSLDSIREYIRNNVRKWKIDEENPNLTIR